MRNVLIVVLLPIILLPLPVLWNTKESYCAYVILYMGLLWVTEAVPLAITALIPVMAFPLLGVATAAETSGDANFVFFGSMVMAVAVESNQLHERIALRVLLLTGSNPRWLILGFQIATAVISMWISNTGTTAMMTPIALAVIQELERCRIAIEEEDYYIISHREGEEQELDMSMIPPRQLKIYKAVLLSIAFTASIGGTGTLIGTGSNVVLSGYLESEYGSKTPVTFASWMLFVIPQCIILVLACWLWLQIIFVGFRKHDNSSDQSVKRLLVKKYKSLGPIKYEEKCILVIFVILVLLWFFRNPKFMPGWGKLFEDGYVTDGTAAMGMSILMFVIPGENPLTKANDGTPYRPLLTWKHMTEKFNWGTIILLGGGYAMATGVENSGLSDFISSKLANINNLPEWIFLSIACIMVTFLTEFSSNVATSSIFIPMVQSIAIEHGVNPLYYMIPVTLSSSFAFMFPAAPPNAIVFGTKMLTIPDMMLGGSMLNVVALIVSQIVILMVVFCSLTSGYISSYSPQGYNFQQSYLLSQPYAQNGYVVNSYPYSGYSSYNYPSFYPYAKPNPGMMPGGFPEPGNIGWGNNVASFMLFCHNCGRG